MRMIAICCCVALASLVGASGRDEAIDLHAVPLPFKSPRLLGMSMDDDGYIWLGSTHRAIYRYDPRTGASEEFKLPFDSSTSQTICAGRKVYLLGQSYPRMMIYDRGTGRFSEAEYPSAKPDVWYGTELVDGRHIYLFDRGSAGLIKWDTATDTGEAIPYPYKTSLPSFGRLVAEDGALWCAVWDYTGGQYLPLGLATFDLKRETFTEWCPFPAASDDNKPFRDPANTLFFPRTLQGSLVPFDVKARRWCKAIPVPEHGERFGFIGLGSIYRGRWYFSLSTYNGSEIGCDGKPYHFCNALLEFDPKRGRFAFPTLEVEDAYYQVSYHLSTGEHLYATANNIREPDGSLNGARTGDTLFWQTRKPSGR